jgi:dihydropteroate synthase
MPADLINDVWGVAPRSDLVDLAAERRVPIVLMHNREHLSTRTSSAKSLRISKERSSVQSRPASRVTT